MPNKAIFTNHKNRSQAKSSVFSQIMWDNNNLYIAFTVTDSDIIANYLNQDTAVFDNDDLVEIFFDFDG